MLRVQSVRREIVHEKKNLAILLLLSECIGHRGIEKGASGDKKRRGRRKRRRWRRRGRMRCSRRLVKHKNEK